MLVRLGDHAGQLVGGRAGGAQAVHGRGRRGVREQHGRDDHDGLRAAVGGGAQLGGDAVAGREASGDVQAEAQAVFGLGFLVVGLGGGEAGVEGGEPVAGDADALVDDGQHHVAGVGDVAETFTLASGGEKVVAFSRSSATTCEMSSAACPATCV